ncbi:MAG: transglutaminase domain-containing protein [Gammaproteobacteria bacterium]
MNNQLEKLRSAPPFIIAAALLLWGWQTNFILFAIPMIIIIELARWVSWRWPISNKEFHTLSDFSGVGFFIVVIYIFTTVGSRGIFVILSIMPFILFLLLVVQLYSEDGKIGLSSLFVSLRRLDAKKSPDAPAKVDFSLPYLLVCIISASSGNIRTIWFFILSFILFSIVLWSFRPQRYQFRTWFILLFLAAGISYAGQEGLRDIQRSLEASIVSVFDQFMWRYRDPERATTAIGTIGRLKLSDRIFLRADSEERLHQPLYLKEASYHQYNYGVWKNQKSVYTVIDQELDGSWQLADVESGKEITLSTNIRNEISVIPLPIGTARIENVTAFELSKNNFGTVKMEIQEGWIDYKAVYQDKIFDSKPVPADLNIAENYREDFERLARDLDLYNKPHKQVVSSVESFFQNNFTYTLTQNRRYPRGKYLQNFLFNSRSGHCEFFATSTALLLRVVGIPTRYAVGYVVDEYSQIEGQYVARSRDSHSWVQAYIDDQWRIVDTTPAIWAPLEDENASFFEPFMDIYSWISYRYSLYQSNENLDQEETNYNLLYMLIPLILILVWRLVVKERIIRNKAKSKNVSNNSFQGKDSSIYALIDELNKAGFVRRKGETLACWFVRVNETTHISELDTAITLHYKYRFDPDDSKSGIKDDLARLVRLILSRGVLSTVAKNPL